MMWLAGWLRLRYNENGGGLNGLEVRVLMAEGREKVYLAD